VLPAFALLGQPTGNNGQFDSGKLSNDAFSWRLTARYALSDRQSLYATYSRGLRPRVLTGVSGGAPYAAAVFNPLAAETLDNYEVGYKAALFGKTLAIDTAIYINDYQHFSTTIVQQGKYVSIDAGQAQTYGLEAQLIWTVMKGVHVFGAYAYTHGRFGAGLYDGNHFRLTPDHTVSLGGAYRFPVLGGTVEVLPRYQWKSKYYFNEDNGKLSEQNYILNEIITNQYQNAFGKLDLRIGYSLPNQPWKLEVYSTNLTNQKFLKDAGNVGQSIGLPTYIPGEPRHR
jgi:iron complex outermembrane recepter protein